MRIQRSMSTGDGRALLLFSVVTIILSLLPISSHATVDWTEGFEYADNAAMIATWSSSCLAASHAGIMEVSTARSHSGSKSLKLTYPPPDSEGGCFMDRFLTAKSDTLYTRFYMYMENFTVNSVGTKVTFQGQNGAYPSYWWVMMGAPIMSVTVQGIILDNGTLDSVNIFGGAISQNQWVCVELRETMSSPGVDNGVLQQWINGTQTLNRTNQRMRASTLNQLNSPTAQLEFVRLYRQHGVGTIYYDDYAVSRDARIGCSGSAPTSDTVPPAIPTELSVK